MAELDFEREGYHEDDVQPILPRTERPSTHFITSSEIFQSTHAMQRHDMLANAERKAALSRLANAQHEEAETPEA